MDLWVPYDFNLIMRRGHAVNSSIPEDPAEAEFPNFHWGDEVIIRIESLNPVPAASIPAPTGDPPRPFTPTRKLAGPSIGPDSLNQP
jgi:hypothetical protein